MRLFDICTRKFYEKDGEKKVKWYRAGVMKETDKGTMFIRLFHLPEIDFFVYERIEPDQKEENRIIKY
jgi:hypothetical protein